VIRQGEIVTFYSYKGGVGRSMALANVAWILASNGRSVLTIDWDLEAPGLHRYFGQFMTDPQLTSTEGIIDFCFDFAVASATSGVKLLTGAWDLRRYAVSLDWEFPNGGSIDLIPAGLQGPAYGTRVNGFDWRAFYEKLGGQRLLEDAQQTLRQEYDYVLIDSRTGLSDTSGICTVQLPDKVVLCFTYNHQSVEGTAGVAEAIARQRNSGPRLYPLPMRSDPAEKAKLERARDAARWRFSPFLLEKWGMVEIPYVPFYAYEETLAVFGDDTFSKTSLLAAMERLTGWLTDEQVNRLPPIPTELREMVLAKFSR
jgi:MinD-like ATPase involved in chromosome partitioning or flagellar assembly